MFCARSRGAAPLAAVGWRERVEIQSVEVEPLPVVDPIEFAREWALGQFGPLSVAG